MDRLAEPSDPDENETLAQTLNGVNSGQSLRYACTRCRSRKIKCDRQLPCKSCIEVSAQCKPLQQKQRKSTVRTKGEESSQARLRRLEDLVEWLLVARGDTLSAEDGLAVTPPDNAQNQENAQPAGRLIHDKSGRRYITDKLWADIIEELEADINSLDISKPRYVPSMLGDLDHGFTRLRAGIIPLGMSSKFPRPPQLTKYWNFFVENVDFLLKIIHKPTVRPIFFTFGIRQLPPDQDALANSICFAVLTSLTDDEVRETFGGDRITLLQQYRAGLEEALSHARLLEAPSLTAVQAFVLYLHCLPALGYSSQVWTLTGLALRIAQSLGLHRDGEKLGISPFESELRRRLWFAICFIDNRSWQSSGTESVILKGHGDTKLPSNVDDADISPECQSIPSRTGAVTDSTLTLLRSDIMRAGVSVSLKRDALAPREHKSQLTPEESEKISREIGVVHRRINDSYGQDLDLTQPKHALCDALTAIVLLKLWRIAYASPQFHPLPEIKEKLFETDVEILERVVDMWEKPWAQKWMWLLRGHIHWKIMASVALELQTRSKGSLVTRAWEALDKAFTSYQNIPFDERTSSMFEGILRLRDRAKQHHSYTTQARAEPSLNGNGNGIHSESGIFSNSPFEIDFWGNPISRLNLPAQMPMTMPDYNSAEWQAWLQSGELVDF